MHKSYDEYYYIYINNRNLLLSFYCFLSICITPLTSPGDWPLYFHNHIEVDEPLSKVNTKG